MTRRVPRSRDGVPGTSTVPEPVLGQNDYVGVAGSSSPDKANTHDLVMLLDQLAANPEHSPMARTMAARAALEARGLLGKHQAAPGTASALVPLSHASRDELEAELARLRSLF